eukprot:COSAG02_NODE_20509_length_828_cov_0.801097_2_plen_38_part_01
MYTLVHFFDVLQPLFLGNSALQLKGRRKFVTLDRKVTG